ncbi:hypothetical protein PV797_17305 [Clostridiaceae bacterium M8S5]|nr:hypothetical protein PV797_17305 [Clostridiaceae bacterium M8S5]
MKKRMYLIILPIGIMILSSIAFGQPGSQDDPLVTLKYVQKRIDQVKFYVDEKTNGITSKGEENAKLIQDLTNENKQLKEKISKLQVSGASTLDVVELKNGQTLVCKSGCEIILRGGSAKAVASQNGGLADITAGLDIQMNQDIPYNHMLIVPRSDSRGVVADKYAILMVRGSYEIK